MTDLSSVSAILGSIKTAADITKIIISSDAGLEKAELKIKLADLLEALAVAKIETASIKSELLAKDEEVLELREQLEVSNSVLYDPPYYFIEKEGSKEGPFCQHCYDSTQKLIRLQQPGRVGFWVCNACKCKFKDKNYVPSDTSGRNGRGGGGWVQRG